MKNFYKAILLLASLSISSSFAAATLYLKDIANKSGDAVTFSVDGLFTQQVPAYSEHFFDDGIDLTDSYYTRDFDLHLTSIHDNVDFQVEISLVDGVNGHYHIELSPGPRTFNLTSEWGVGHARLVIVNNIRDISFVDDYTGKSQSKVEALIKINK